MKKLPRKTPMQQRELQSHLPMRITADPTVNIDGEEYYIANLEPPFYERGKFGFAVVAAGTSLFIFWFSWWWLWAVLGFSYDSIFSGPAPTGGLGGPDPIEGLIDLGLGVLALPVALVGCVSGIISAMCGIMSAIGWCYRIWWLGISAVIPNLLLMFFGVIVWFLFFL